MNLLKKYMEESFNDKINYMKRMGNKLVEPSALRTNYNFESIIHLFDDEKPKKLVKKK